MEANFIRIDILRHNKTKTKDEDLKKLKLFENREIGKLFENWDLRDYLKKPKVKPSRKAKWLKSGHAPCRVELATFMAVSGRYATAS